MNSRLFRRKQYRRLKKQRSNYWDDGHVNPRHQGLKVSAPKPTSSCACCMNQRMIEGETRQEKQSRLTFEEQTKSYLLTFEEFENTSW